LHHKFWELQIYRDISMSGVELFFLSKYLTSDMIMSGGMNECGKLIYKKMFLYKIHFN